MKRTILKQMGLLFSTAALLLAGCGQTTSQAPTSNATSSASHLASSSVETERLQAPTAALVATRSGTVQGQEADGVRSWYGVPYGGDVSGARRWQVPTDPEPWSGTLDATQAGPLAIQLSNGQVVGEENALNLDIYRPASDAKKLPVMVFVHGGNNQSGKSAEISGASFVKNHGAIVVSVNYRLGLLGFNPLPAIQGEDPIQASGNYTLLDIAQSLKWVRQNIEAFGGDSQNVTIAGFSAGGRDVMTMLISPVFEGLFDKAISFSGGLTTADPEASQQVVAQALAPLVVEDGKQADEVAAVTWLLSDAPEVKAYLEGLEASRLAGLMGNAGIRMSVFPHLYRDGAVLPAEGFATQNFNDVPLLNLTGTQEFSLFARFDKYFAESSKDGSINTDPAKKAQYDFVNRYGGMLYALANVTEANQTLVAGGYSSPIYSMTLTYGEDAQVVGEQMAPLGAFHGNFVPLLDKDNQNYAALIGEAYANAGAKQLATDFQTYLYNFLKSGDPNNDALPTWTNWQANQQQLVLTADQQQVKAELASQAYSYEEILNQMAADTSLDEATKVDLIKQVLNGRWFSYRLAQAYDNLSEFSQANGG